MSDFSGVGFGVTMVTIVVASVVAFIICWNISLLTWLW